LQNLWYPINNFSKAFLCEVINRQNQGVFTSFWEAGGETEDANWNENLRPSSPVSLVLAYGKDLWRDTQNVSQKLQAEGIGRKNLSFRAHPPPPPTTESRPGCQTTQIILPPSGGNSFGAKEIDRA
jgi:hypothetical protein